MGLLFVLVTLAIAAGVAVYLKGHSCCGKKNKKANLESFRKDGWFGAKSIKAGEALPKDSTEIRPFKVNVPESDLEDLNRRLTNARYVDHVEDTQFTYGFNSNYLKNVIEYWRTNYDWRTQEGKLNEQPQFVTQIEGLDVHFIRVKPTKQAKTVLPLLVIHGWPGSVLEYYKSFPLYTEPDQNGLAFEVVAPSIPGYGFSEAPHQKGFNTTAAARVFVKLMSRLGHDRFVVHGGDWGSVITRNIATIYPENVIGAHACGNYEAMRFPESRCQQVQAFVAENFPKWYFGADYNENDYKKLFPIAEKKAFLYHETGYMHIQSTKPDTVAAGLVDSPVGLAAYILEKFSTWTNPAYRNQEDGALTEKFTLDELLTNISIYWFSGNIASSQRFYKENASPANRLPSQQIQVPFATVDTPYEIARAPRKFIEKSYANLVQYSDFPRGGHFTAFEEPELVNSDIRSFVEKVIAQQGRN